MKKKFNLTPVEQEFMSILWNIKQGSVHDILAHLPKKRKLAYTSVSTILRILEKKKILKSEKIGRQHLYSPLISASDFQEHAVKKIINTVFSGTPLQLLSYLVDTNDLSKEEITWIEKRLADKKRGA